MNTRVLAAALAACLAVPSVAGCGGGAGHADNVNNAGGASGGDDDAAKVAVAATSAVGRPLTPQVAARAFRTFAADDDVARASADERLAIGATTDGMQALTAAEYQQADFNSASLPRWTYATPTFYTPRLTTYPQWFIASVSRAPRGAKGSRQRLLMGFTLDRAGGSWQLALQTRLDAGQSVPSVQVDSAGYATALATFDSQVLIPPRTMVGVTGQYIQYGPISQAATVMNAGPQTTGRYAANKAQAKADRAQGQAVQSGLFATPFAIFPLRLTDGGALVLYAARQTTITFMKKKGAKLPVPGDAAYLLGTLLIKNQVSVDETLQFAAVDPPKPTGKTVTTKSTVIAGYGAPTKATTT